MPIRLPACLLAVLALNAIPCLGQITPSARIVVASDIEAFLQQMVLEEHFSGIALAVRAGEVLHANAYRAATEDQANSLQTLFHVASVTKQFTAAATLQLVDQGKIELSDSINEHLPERYRSEMWVDVSVHHLLSHSSGIPDYALERDYYNVVDGFCLGDTVDGMIREAQESELRFLPGTEYEYSNIGFTLLGEIIEHRSETPYHSYVEDKLLEPLGMGSSRLHIVGHEPEQSEASGHRWNEELHRHTKDLKVTLPVTAPDGGLITNIDDFYRWTRIYTGEHGEILSDDALKKMVTPVVETGEVYGRGKTTSYGYGLYLGDGLISHEGYIVGFRSHFILDPKDDELVVVFTNNTTNDPARISAGMLAIIESE
jgi:D-alanyl-D-alanine carboxypeptidase